jgi:hypothetical protein
MSRVTTIITGPDGSVTRVVTRRSGCGCLTVLAFVVVVFGPAAWFGPVGAVLAYSALAVIALLAAAGWGLQRLRRGAPPQPPPVPAPPPPPR